MDFFKLYGTYLVLAANVAIIMSTQLWVIITTWDGRGQDFLKLKRDYFVLGSQCCVRNKIIILNLGRRNSWVLFSNKEEYTHISTSRFLNVEYRPYHLKHFGLNRSWQLSCDATRFRTTAAFASLASSRPMLIFHYDYFIKNRSAKSGPYYWSTCVKAVNFYKVSTP
jgi:hypothetical protein